MGFLSGSSESAAAQKRQAQKQLKKQAQKDKKKVQKLAASTADTAAQQIGTGVEQAVQAGPLNLVDQVRQLREVSPVLPAGLSGTGLGIQISPQGQVAAAPSAERNQFFNRIGAGLDEDVAGYNALLGQLTPGFGKVTEARRKALEDAARRAVGDLQSNLARRRVAGSSFADAQEGQLRAEYDKAIAEGDAQSFLDELSATTTLMEQKTKARTDAVNSALSQVNYETGVGATILQGVQNAMSAANQAAVDLVKTAANITATGAETAATIRGSLGQSAIGAIGGLGQQQMASRAGLQSDFAKLAAEREAASGQLIGNIAGLGLGAIAAIPTGGASLASIPALAGGALKGASLFGKAAA